MAMFNSCVTNHQMVLPLIYGKHPIKFPKAWTTIMVQDFTTIPSIIIIPAFNGLVFQGNLPETIDFPPPHQSINPIFPGFSHRFSVGEIEDLSIDFRVFLGKGHFGVGAGLRYRPIQGSSWTRWLPWGEIFWDVWLRWFNFWLAENLENDDKMMISGTSGKWWFVVYPDWRNNYLPLTVCHGKSPLIMGKSTN